MTDPLHSELARSLDLVQDALTTPSTIPYRFRPISTLRYLTCIQNIQNAQVPQRWTIDPSVLDLSAETCTCRLRDSVQSFLQGHTHDASIDPTKLKTAWSLYYVTHDGKLVYVVPKGEKKTTPGTFQPELVQAPTTPVLEVPSDTPELVLVLRACALLLSLRILQTPVRIPSSVFPTDLQTELTSTYDIALRAEGDSTIMI